MKTSPGRAIRLRRFYETNPPPQLEAAANKRVPRRPVAWTSLLRSAAFPARTRSTDETNPTADGQAPGHAKLQPYRVPSQNSGAPQAAKKYETKPSPRKNGTKTSSQCSILFQKRTTYEQTAKPKIPAPLFTKRTRSPPQRCNRQTASRAPSQTFSVGFPETLHKANTRPNENAKQTHPAQPTQTTLLIPPVLSGSTTHMKGATLNLKRSQTRHPGKD